MLEFRAYILGSDGHIERRVDLVCADEEAAKERARELAQASDVELWQRDKRIAVFHRFALTSSSTRIVPP